MNPMDQISQFENHEAHMDAMLAEWEKVGRSKKRLAAFRAKYGVQNVALMRHIDNEIKKK